MVTRIPGNERGRLMYRPPFKYYQYTAESLLPAVNELYDEIPVMRIGDQARPDPVQLRF